MYPERRRSFGGFRSKSFGGFRNCASTVLDECSAWDGIPRGGPRRGGLQRSFTSDFDAAGHPFDNGEPEARAISIDSVTRRRRVNREAIISSLREGGAAGSFTPRVDYQAEDIDSFDGRRRAHSEPPEHEKPRQTRAELQQSMAVFGVAPGIDDEFRKRRRSIDPMMTETRDQKFKRAATFGDIDDLLKRKQFHNSPKPGTLVSPRLLARSVETVDIDARAGRVHRKTEASTGIIPFSSPSVDEIPQCATKYPGSPRGWSSNAFFKHTLEAKKYAKLLGRPDNTSYEPVRALPALKRENLQELEAHSFLEQEQLANRAQPDDSPALSHRSRCSVSMSEISTCASASELTRSQGVMRQKSLSKAARKSLANVMKERVGDFVHFDSDLKIATVESNYDSGMTAPKTPRETTRIPRVNLGSLQRVQVPLNLHRVLSSINTEKMNVPDSLSDIKSALSPIFQQSKYASSGQNSDLTPMDKVEACYFDQPGFGG